jgi:hypothetical protein
VLDAPSQKTFTQTGNMNTQSHPNYNKPGDL